jgi:DNA polymerase III subunit gamma/tau
MGALLEGATASMAKKKSSSASGPGKDATVVLAAPYVVLARKYRPTTFAELVGQEAMVTTLRNAFATDRIA